MSKLPALAACAVGPCHTVIREWSGGAMVLGKLPAPGRGVVGWCDGAG